MQQVFLATRGHDLYSNLNNLAINFTVTFTYTKKNTAKNLAMNFYYNFFRLVLYTFLILREESFH